MDDPRADKRRHLIRNDDVEDDGDEEEEEEDTSRGNQVNQRPGRDTARDELVEIINLSSEDEGEYHTQNTRGKEEAKRRDHEVSSNPSQKKQRRTKDTSCSTTNNRQGVFEDSIEILASEDDADNDRKEIESYQGDNRTPSDRQNKIGECPFGESCYRKNPQHFIEYSHPSSHRAISTTVISTARDRDNRDSAQWHEPPSSKSSSSSSSSSGMMEDMVPENQRHLLFVLNRLPRFPDAANKGAMSFAQLLTDSHTGKCKVLTYQIKKRYHTNPDAFDSL